MTNKQTFEQNAFYGELPATNSELNMREVYDRVCRINREPQSRSLAADELANLVNDKVNSLGLAPFSSTDQSRPYSTHLNEHGWVKLPNLLSNEQIAEIFDYIENEPITNMYNHSQVFTLDNIPEDANMGRYSSEFNANCPHIFDAINNDLVLKVVENFLGAKPTLSVLLLMWSFKTLNPAQEMQKFHRDNDDYRFCKLFILLTDVDSKEDGPHLYIKRSRTKEEIKTLLNSKTELSQEKRDKLLNEIFKGGPGHRYSDELVDDIFQHEDYFYQYGKRGTSIIEDTWAVHRGIPPTAKHRLLLQAQFSLQPTPMFTYKPLDIQRADNSSSEIQYVNRLYMK